MTLASAMSAMARTQMDGTIAATIERWSNPDLLDRERITDPASPYFGAQPNRLRRDRPEISGLSIRYFIRSSGEVGFQSVRLGQLIAIANTAQRTRPPRELRPLRILAARRLAFDSMREIQGRTVARLVATARPRHGSGSPPWTPGSHEILDVDLETGYILHSEAYWRETPVSGSDLVDIVPGEEGPESAFQLPPRRTAPERPPGRTLAGWAEAAAVAPFTVVAPRLLMSEAHTTLVWWPAGSTGAHSHEDGALEVRALQPYGDRFLRLTQGRSRLRLPDSYRWAVVPGDRPTWLWSLIPRPGQTQIHEVIVDAEDGVEVDLVSNLDRDDVLAIARALSPVHRST